MEMSFTQKTLRISISMGDGTARVVEGLETHVTVEKPGLPDKAKAKVSISNMAYEDMAQLTMLAFKTLKLQKNTISIMAGSVGEELSLVFEGEIQSAFADFTASPTVKMKFDCLAGVFPALEAAAPHATKGEAKAATLIEQYAGQMGYSFKNEGVTSSVLNAVFNGSSLEKAEAVANQVGAQLLIDDGEVILLPYDKTRSGATVALSDSNGLIGYPTFTNDGVAFECFFNAGLKIGGAITLESIVPGASGTWKISKLSHDLTAYSPSGGRWVSKVEGVPA